MARSMTLFVTLSLFLAVAPAQEPTAQETFYRAFYLEEGLRKLDEAQKTYGQAAVRALAAGDHELAVKAMLARAELLRKLRRPDEARSLLEKALELTPESEDLRRTLVALATPQEAGIAAEVARILREYYGRGQKDAAKKLERLGAQAVGPLIGELEGAPPHILRAIAEHLGTFAGEELVEPFAQCLESTDSASRTAAAQGVLVNDRSDLVKLRLIDVALKSRDPQVRYAAASGLSMGIWWFETPELSEAFASFLARALSLDDNDLRKHLLLSHWRQPESVWPLVAPAIERMARSEDDATRELAVSAWAKWSQMAADQAEAEVTKSAADAVADAAADLLAHRDWEVRRRAAETLPWLPEWPERIRPRMLAALRRAILEPDRREGIGPIPAAGRWLQTWDTRQKKSLLPASFSASEILDLYALIGSEDARLQPHVAAQFRTSLAQRGLWNPARSKSEQEAIAAAGLRRIPDADGLVVWLQSTRDLITDVDALLDVMENEDSRVRKAAYSALIRASQRGHRLDPKTKPPKKLLEDLASKDADLRSYARGAADRFHHPDLVPGLRAYLARLHEEHAEKSGTMNFTSALGRLASLAGEEALPDLRAWLEQHPGSPSLFAYLPKLLGEEVQPVFLDLAVRGGFVENLVRALNKREERVTFITRLPPKARGGAIDCAASVLDDAALEGWLREILTCGGGDEFEAARMARRKHLAGLWPELLALLEHENPEVREAAKQALEEIRWYHDVKASLETFGPTGRAEALAEAKKLASSEDPVQRRGAAFALAALGDPAAVPALLELLKDTDAAVREAAVQALQRLGNR